MIRWLIAFFGAWGICLAGIYLAWIVGLTIHCLFIPGCAKELSIDFLTSSVNIKSVMTRGTLLTIALIAISWINLKRIE